MALLKQVETAEGVTVEYWKITSLILDTYYNTINLELSGWINEDARRNGKLPLIKLSFYIDNIEDYEQNLLEYCYNYIKSTDNEYKIDFSTAQDV